MKTKIDIQRVIELYRTGIKTSEIAKIFEVSSSAINYILNKNNLRQKNTNYSPKITDSVSEIILLLHNNNKTPNQISKIVDITATGIRLFLKRNSLSPNFSTETVRDKSRPCVICGTIFIPKCDDGIKKEKYKTCSRICANKSISMSKIKYTNNQIDQVIELKKNNIPNNIIELETNININKIKEIVKNNQLYVSSEQAQANAYQSKLNKDPMCMTKMRETHMKYSAEEFEKRLLLLEQDVLEGKGTASGLASKYDLVAASVVERLHRDGKSHLIGVHASTCEMELYNLVKEWLPDIEVFHNDRKTIYPKELDIHIPSKKVAIEYNGLYWHTENRVGKNAHYDKMKMANSEGVRLLTIFEHEWLTRNAQVKNFLKSVLGISDQVVAGRKTEILEIDKKTAKDFLESNHIQGAAHISIVFFGIFYENTLSGVMSFGNHHRDTVNKDILVLDRLCFLDGISILGGSSKLLSHAIKWAKSNNYTKIISWSDNRWSEGKVYEKMGFTLEEELKPDYFYIKGSEILSKQSCQKKHLLKKGAIGTTEKEMAISLGYERVWDCGKKRWIINL